MENVGEGEEVVVAGWPVARQQPQRAGRHGFVTIEDETAYVQLILCLKVFHRSRRPLGSHVLLVRGAVSRWDGAVNVVASEVMDNHSCVPMPAAHDWH